MRPAAQAVTEMAVRQVTIGHELPLEGARQHVRQDLQAARADKKQRRIGRREDPQPKRLARFLPWRFVGMEQRRLLDFPDHLVFQRRHGAPGLADGFVEHAGAKLQIEQLDEELPDARARQAHAQRQENDGARQARADQTPLPQFDPVPQWIVRRGVVRCARHMSAGAWDGVEAVARDLEEKTDLPCGSLGDVDLIPSGIGLRAFARQVLTAHGAAVREVLFGAGDRQFLHAADPLRAGLLARLFAAGRFIRRTGCALDRRVRCFARRQGRGAFDAWGRR